MELFGFVEDNFSKTRLKMKKKVVHWYGIFFLIFLSKSVLNGKIFLKLITSYCVTFVKIEATVHVLCMIRRTNVIHNGFYIITIDRTLQIVI